MMKTLVHFVVFDTDLSDEDKELASKAGISIHQFEDVITKGKEVRGTDQATTFDAKPSDCVMFSYTSGTTGVPKGVKLSHKMLVS